MSINFNIGGGSKELVVPDGDEVKEEDLDDEDDDDGKDYHSYDLKNRLIKFVLIICGLLVLLLIVLYLSSLVNKKAYDYEDLEKVLKNAAVAYFKDYPDELPKTEKKVAKIEDSTLVAAGKMKDLSSYTKKGVTCSGSVEVRKSGTTYVYTPYLNCGDQYATTKLSTALKNKVVESGYGLYKKGDEYIFRGEKVNNYVKLDNSLWQVVKINSGGSVMIIRSERSNLTYPWDNRYNVEQKYNVGINNFNSSRLKESLAGIYNDDTTLERTPILSANDKSKLISFDLCIGKRSMDNSTNDYSVECSEKVENVKMGVLTLSDYINASIDNNCKNADSKSCQNYNYLNCRYNYWLVTANPADSYHAYMVNSSGIISNSYTNDYGYLRPVVYLNNSVMISGGEGTEQDPYIVK